MPRPSRKEATSEPRHHPRPALGSVHSGEPFRLLLRPQETANALGISLRGLMNMVDRGEIPFVRVGTRNLRFALADLHTWIRERSTRRPAVDQGGGRDRRPSRETGREGRTVNKATNGKPRRYRGEVLDQAPPSAPDSEKHR